MFSQKKVVSRCPNCGRKARVLYPCWLCGKLCCSSCKVIVKPVSTTSFSFAMDREYCLVECAKKSQASKQ